MKRLGQGERVGGVEEKENGDGCQEGRGKREGWGILKLEAEKSFCKVGGNNKMDWDQYQLPNKKGVKLIRPIQLDSIYL